LIKKKNRDAVYDLICNNEVSEVLMEYNSEDIIRTITYGTDDAVRELFITFTLYALKSQTVLPGSMRSMRLMRFMLYLRKADLSKVEVKHKVSLLENLLSDNLI